MRSRLPSVWRQRLEMAATELLLVAMLMAEAVQGHLGTMREPNHGSSHNGTVDGGDAIRRDITQISEPVQCRRNAIGKGDRLKVIRALHAAITSDQRSRTAQKRRQRLRMIHGREMSPRDLPFHVLVVADNTVICSGALIKEDAVLTAAQCVYQHKKWVVQLGSVELLIQREGRQMIYGTRVETHPDYGQSKTQNDLAIIFLEKPADLSDIVQIARLPTDAIYENLVGRIGIVAGWGRTETTEECSQVLRYAPLVVNPDENCKVYFGDDYDAKKSFCAGGMWGANVCNGDNGSPFSVGSDAGFVVVGVASFIFTELCLPDFPSGFTRITAYLQWISSTAEIKLT